MENIGKTEYLHIASGKVYSHSEDYEDTYPQFLKFQESNNPKELGFTYERDYKQAKEQEPETV